MTDKTEDPAQSILFSVLDTIVNRIKERGVDGISIVKHPPNGHVCGVEHWSIEVTIKPPEVKTQDGPNFVQAEAGMRPS